MILWGWNYLEADFYRCYGLDLYEEIWEKDMSSRRFVVLVSGLPPDAAWARFLQDNDQWELAKTFT